MRSRPLLVPCLALACALLAGACLPWNVGTRAAVARVDRDLRAALGIALTASGGTQFALLPWPRLTFREVALANDGRPLATGDALTVRLALLPLLVGRAEATELSLTGATVTLAASPGDDRWGLPLRRLAAQAVAGAPAAHLARVALRASTLIGLDPRSGAPEIARDVALVARWPGPGAALDVAGSLSWRGRPVAFSLADLRPAAVLSGASTPLSAALTWPGGRLSLEGTGTLEGGARVEGSARLATDALGPTLEWLGADIALAPLVGALGLEARFATSEDGLVLPSLRVSAGSNVLDGAGGVSLSGGRLAAMATLAADTVDLAPLLPPLRHALDGEAGWGRDPLALDRFTGCDLDLRLSAGAAALGSLRFEDVAAGLQVKAGSIEATIGRATLQGGTVKGRVGLAAATAGADLRALASLDRVDLGALLLDLGGRRWVDGAAQGQLALEGTGASMDAIARHLSGRASLSMREGELPGISLADALEHPEGAPAGGRTRFDQAALAATFLDGVGTLTGTTLQASALRARLDGQVSVPRRSLQARAELEADGRTGALFDVAGPWTGVSARPLGAPSAPDGMTLPRAALPPRANAYAR